MKRTVQILKHGYTLVELMVAISILALLFAAGVTSYNKSNQRSKDVRRKSDLQQIRSALEMYRADIGYYPPKSCTADLCSLVQVDSTNLGELDSYIQTLPTDPASAAIYYQYRPVTIVGTPPNTKAYGYCVYAVLELASSDDLSGCVDPNVASTGDYAVKNP